MSGEPIAPLTPESANFRAVLGHFATGVTIITATHDREPVGMAASSFTSVSLDPPLVLFCAAKSSSTWPSIEAAKKWCVNVLGDDGEELCRTFATKGADRFAGVGYRAGASGSPVLHDALAFVDCETYAEYDGGDHVIVVGRVLELGHRTAGRTLLFYRGGYGRYEV